MQRVHIFLAARSAIRKASERSGFCAMSSRDRDVGACVRNSALTMASSARTSSADRRDAFSVATSNYKTDIRTLHSTPLAIALLPAQSAHSATTCVRRDPSSLLALRHGGPRCTSSTSCLSCASFWRLSRCQNVHLTVGGHKRFLTRFSLVHLDATRRTDVMLLAHLMCPQLCILQRAACSCITPRASCPLDRLCGSTLYTASSFTTDASSSGTITGYQR